MTTSNYYLLELFFSRELRDNQEKKRLILEVTSDLTSTSSKVKIWLEISSIATVCYSQQRSAVQKTQTADSTDRAHGPVLSMRDIWQTAVLLPAKGVSSGQFSVFIGSSAVCIVEHYFPSCISSFIT